MKILITGGLGHIGSYITNSCIFDDYEITVVDNFTTQRYCSLMERGYNFDFIQEGFETLPIEFLDSFEVILHLAAITNAAASFDNKDQIEEVNVNLTKRLIDKVAKCSSKPLFIFPSSTSVYGTAEEDVNEASDPNPQSPYADSKLEIEHYISSLKDFNYVTFRFGTVFGVSPGMRFHTAINKFCFELIFKQPLVVWKNAIDYFRPYAGLEDIATAINSAVKDKYPPGIYNVVSENAKLSDILAELKTYADEDEMIIDYVNTPLLNQHSYYVSIDKIRKLGFDPQDKIKNGIRETIRCLQ